MKEALCDQTASKKRIVYLERLRTAVRVISGFRHAMSLFPPGDLTIASSCTGLELYVDGASSCLEIRIEK